MTFNGTIKKEVQDALEAGQPVETAAFADYLRDKNPAEAAEYLDALALNGIKSAIRKCVKAVTDEFAPVIPGLLIPIAVFVADEDGRSYRSTKNLTIRELKVAIALLK